MSSSNDIPQFSDVLSIQSNPEDLFTLLYPLGMGAYGKVYKAMHKSTLKIFAIKIIDYTKNCLDNNKKISFNYNSIQEEASLMRLLQKNDYVLKYYGSYYSRKSNTIWLILEHCFCGSLVDVMLSIDRGFSEIEIATFMEMVLKGLIFLHDLNIIHRDIKAQNILLTEDGCAKLGDFGVGIKLTDEEFRQSKKGSPYWMSPQVALQEKYDTKTDIWSLGITCIELFETEPPWGDLDLKPSAVMNKIGKTPPKVEEVIDLSEHSQSFIDFVKQCLIVDPNKRPSARELIDHEFIKKKAKGKQYIQLLIKEKENEINNFIIEKSKELERIQKQKEKEINNFDNKENNDVENKEGSLNEKNKESFAQNLTNKIEDNNEELYSERNENSNKDIEPENNDDINNNKVINNSQINNEELYSERNENSNKENEPKKNDEINNNNENNDYQGNSMIVIDENQNEEIGTIIEETKKILDEIDVDSNEQDEEIEDYNQKKLEEMKKEIQAKIDKKKKKEEEKKIEENKAIKEDNKYNMKTPSKKNKKDFIENNFENNYSMNIIDKANNDIKTLLSNENHKKENKKININNFPKKRSEVTTGFTGSKTDSSDGKKFMSNNIIKLENKILYNENNNNIYTKKKIDFINHDLSNIDDDSEDEGINPIKTIYNVNFEDNKLEKCLTDRNYLRTEIKQNKINFLDKEKIGKYLNDFDINTKDENCSKNIHFSAYKKHKKYFK